MPAAALHRRAPHRCTSPGSVPLLHRVSVPARMDRPIVPRRSETAAETCLEWRKAPKKPKPEQRAKPTQNEKPLCAIAIPRSRRTPARFFFGGLEILQALQQLLRLRIIGGELHGFLRLCARQFR